MTLEDIIHAQRLRVLREAEQTGNVSATCDRYGWSRARFYELWKRFQEYGADGVRPKPADAGGASAVPERRGRATDSGVGPRLADARPAVLQ